MADWGELVGEFTATPDDEKTEWLGTKLSSALAEVSRIRGGNNVLVYASAFLQKPEAPPAKFMIMPEDLNGFMAVIHGMDFDKPLTIVLHTSGGVTTAAETIVSYIRSKFPSIEVIVPAFAMSAGTMIALGSDRIWMGRQSQLGPIDPQFPVPGGSQVSARAVVEQFEVARLEILGDRENKIFPSPEAARVWSPILGSLGPSLLVQAQDAIKFSERMVSNWLGSYMFRDIEDDKKRKDLAQKTAHYFADSTTHKDHGRRIDREEARNNGVKIENFDGPGLQELQEAILTLYHVITISFENTFVTKLIARDHIHQWIKNWAPPGFVTQQAPPRQN